MKQVGRLVSPILALILLGNLVVAWTSSTDVTIPEAPPLSTLNLSAEEKDYVEFIYPRLEALQTELSGIRELVSTRSRNVFALQGHNTKLRNLLETTGDWLDAHPTPERFAAVTEEFRAASTELIAILDAAESSLSSFDFSGVTALIPRFDTVLANVDSLLGQLEPFVNASTRGTMEG